ncbi:hypothetical protein [Parerythrobacter jejuensis]|uniref:GLPGLI family protein n=1 Tax=Parerythrobacter jejuensis TaxID=795812 RepID=A0A845AQ43_9SPHN|nr:hypothetical protein [Parerythrobacter jejuensis]MXP31569.1 hypothetical protein [Parerythrobacter jejuensis]
MSIRHAMITASAAMLFASTPALAQEVETQAIEAKHLESGKHQIDPAKGYLFAKAPNRFNALFIKTPDEEDYAEYKADWEEKLAKARKKFPGKLRMWEANKERRRNPGPKPVEPTEESFAIEPMDIRMFAGFGPQYVYSKEKLPDGETTFNYLTELEPGTYTYYGPLLYLPGAQTIGKCYCMGSVKFEVKAGEITNLGDFLAEGWAEPEARRQASIFWKDFANRAAIPVDYSVPDGLDDLPVVRADLRASGKRNNVLNTMVGRLPSVEGVLAYDRDVPIDLKGLAAQQKAEEAARIAAEAKAEAEARAFAAGASVSATDTAPQAEAVEATASD